MRDVVKTWSLVYKRSCRCKQSTQKFTFQLPSCREYCIWFM